MKSLSMQQSYIITIALSILLVLFAAFLTGCGYTGPGSHETINLEANLTTFRPDGITTASQESVTIARSGPSPVFVEPFYQLAICDGTTTTTATYGTNSETAEQGWSAWWDNLMAFLGGAFIL